MSNEGKVTGPASYFPSIEKKYGHPVEYWFKILENQKQLKHLEMVAYLKAEFEIGHGHANAIVAFYRSQKGL